MRDKVAAWCRQEALFSPGERVICAVSGGADSMAMLWCLHSLRDELQISVCAAHFNHCLRGAESERDERFVRDFCREKGIPLTVGAADVAAYRAQSGKTLEEAAREKRYAFLLSLPCDKLATAHTADDNAETVLLHLLRGSGLRGLCGIPPQREKIVRPLLGVSRQEVLAYLRAEGLSWVEDSTNASDDCQRNLLRHRALPELRALSPQLSAKLTAQSRLLRAEDCFLDGEAEKLLVHEDGAWQIAPLLNAPDVLQKRALRLMLRRALPQDVSLAHIEALQRLLKAQNPSAQYALPGGLWARRRYGLLEITREGIRTFEKTPLQMQGETVLSGVDVKIRCKITENFKKNANTPFHFAIKYDMIRQSIIWVRPRQSGDLLSVDGGHRRSLKKLFIDRRIPRPERDRTPVFTDGKTILAVAGLGVAPQYRPREGEAALLIQIQFT